MNTIIRDAPIGQLIRYLTKNRVLLYPEEKSDYVCPSCYQDGDGTEKPDSASSTLAPTPATEAEPEKHERPASPASLRTAPTIKEANPFDTISAHRTMSRAVTRPEMQKITTRADLEQAYADAVQQPSLRQESRAIEPQKTADGLILVDWTSTDDPENPQNWTSSKKAIVVVQIYLYTLAVYLGSAIITPAEPYLIEQFGITPTVASLVLALYVLGYGIGPLLWSPLSEIPSIGRNPPYMATFGIFVILCIPTALTNSFAGLLVLRFLQGFFGSPCLATGGASIGDLYSFLSLPYFLTGWAAFATAGPALGPLISGFSIPAENWHWSLWEMIWLAGPVFVSMMFFLPETSAPNILARRAARLRKASGNPNIKSQSELDQEKLTVNEILVGNLVRPFQINLLDPAVGFTSLYTALIYAIYYSFFEVFPIVYGSGHEGTVTHGYNLNAGQIGLIFLCIFVGVVIAVPSYFLYISKVFIPEIMEKGLTAPERRLIPAMVVSFLAPIGLFLFAWTGNSSPKIHWIAPTIGISIYTISIFLTLQCIFIYVPMTYPQYSASLFAANDFARSALATGAILFARPLFLNLGVGRGVSLLGGLTVIGIIGIWALYYYGAALRARSKYAAK